jgi:hypothetical protein
MGRSLTSVADALTRDLDEHKFKILHPRHIPLFKSPLVESEEIDKREAAEKHGSPSPKNASSINSEQAGAPPLEHSKSPLDYDPDEPLLRYEHESSTIQLFYDLFFVANLTTFAANHQVSDAVSKCFDSGSK